MLQWMTLHKSNYGERRLVAASEWRCYESRTRNPPCPSGTFQGAGVKTVVLFSDKGAPTRKIWYYELDPGRNLGKTNPLNDDDLAEFVKLQKTFASRSITKAHSNSQKRSQDGL